MNQKEIVFMLLIAMFFILILSRLSDFDKRLNSNEEKIDKLENKNKNDSVFSKRKIGFIK